LIAIHGEVAAGDGCNACRGGSGGEALLEICEIRKRRSWRRVATIEEEVNEDGLNPRPVCRLRKGDKVLIVGVYTPWAEQTHQMQPPSVRQLQRALKLRSLGEALVGQCCVDPWQLLWHALSRANV
jgi:hypothetical protein